MLEIESLSQMLRGTNFLLINPFRPSGHYKFPKSTSGHALSFQHRWMQLYPWLTYSEEKKRWILHLLCGGSDPGILVRHPLVSFSKALEVLSKHATKEYHKMALVRADRFMGVMQKEQLNIRCQINQVMADQIASNRQIRASIIKTILFCGPQNIALRGHRDSTIALERDIFENYGNFWALLQFRVDAGDKILQEHLSTASRNALYTSSTIQNQIIAIICSELQQNIFEKV